MAKQATHYTPLKHGWYSFDLDGYRPCKHTYGLFSYEELPPIDDAQFSGTFGWLTPLDERLDQRMQPYRPPFEQRAELLENLHRLSEEAEKHGLTLPDAFLRLMSSPELQDRVPSCTACYFELSEALIPFPGDEEGYVIRFLNDQQCVIAWYLHIMPTGEQRILVSRYWLDDLKQVHRLDETAREIREQIFVCAPSFEAFMYRFWLENTIWYNLQGKRPLTTEQTRYLKHYTDLQRK